MCVCVFQLWTLEAEVEVPVLQTVVIDIFCVLCFSINSVSSYCSCSWFCLSKWLSLFQLSESEDDKSSPAAAAEEEEEEPKQPDPDKRNPEEGASPQAAPAAAPGSRSGESSSSDDDDDDDTSGSSSSEDEDEPALRRIRSSVAQIKVSWAQSGCQEPFTCWLQMLESDRCCTKCFPKCFHLFVFWDLSKSGSQSKQHFQAK